MTAWRRDLEDAFGTLLGQSLAGFDATTTYAAYYSCSDLSYDLFKEGFDPAALTEVVHPPFDAIPELGRQLAGWDLITPHWTIDLGRSLFRSGEPGEGAEHGLPELDEGVTGADLHRLLTERTLTPQQLARTYP